MASNASADKVFLLGKLIACRPDQQNGKSAFKDNRIFLIAILVLLIVKKIPSLIQGLLSGSPSLGGGDMMGQMKSAASTAVKTVAAVKSGGMTALAGAGKAAGAMSAFSKAAGDMQDWGGHGSGVGGMVKNAASFGNAALGKGAAMMGQGLKAAGSAIKNRNPYTQGRRSAINALAGPNGMLTPNAGNLGSDKNGQPITAESLLDSLNPNNATFSGGSGGGSSSGGTSNGGTSGGGTSNGVNGSNSKGSSGGGSDSKKSAPYEPVQGRAYNDGGERLVAPTAKQVLGSVATDVKNAATTVADIASKPIQSVSTVASNVKSAVKGSNFVQHITGEKGPDRSNSMSKQDKRIDEIKDE